MRKLLPKKEEISSQKAQTLNWYIYLSQSEESKCTWTHSKDGVAIPHFKNWSLDQWHAMQVALPQFLLTDNDLYEVKKSIFVMHF